jgi:hypothetical protein
MYRPVPAKLLGMNGDYLLDDGPLDEAMIRRWAYDLETDLVEQDEDLLLRQWEFSEVMLELAADAECPRADDIIGIWDEFARNSIVHQRPYDIAQVRQALEVAPRFSNAAPVRRWIEDQSARLALVDGIGPVGREKALRMGNTLLNGIARASAISVTVEDPDFFDIELSVPGYAHREWLRICKATGRFRYSRHWPKGATEPHWFEPAL